MNAIELLKQDHQEAAGMMDELETADKGSLNITRDTFRRLKAALTLHTQIEEQVFYPALEQHEETRDIIGEAHSEHNEVKEMLAEMATMNPGSDEFMDKLTELRDSVEHHVEEEEHEMFPKAEKVLGQSRLQEMGRQMEQIKQGQSATATNRRQ
ncbi:MAG TPA: hemerythrin domain-containing protein [Blastocatellia bacterium]|nr:hemerythrin domain-containing protein [Blastocatellia bacterium]